jgi:hypothetical protein
MRPINRWAPVLPVQAMHTFSISQPVATHFRSATCAEVGCTNRERGWETKVPSGSPAEALVRVLSRDHRLRFVETFLPDGVICFTFYAGQRCFDSIQRGHKKSLERPAIHVHRGGDWRGNPTGGRTTMKPADWVDKFREDTDKIVTRIQRG